MMKLTSVLAMVAIFTLGACTASPSQSAGPAESPTETAPQVDNRSVEEQFGDAIRAGDVAAIDALVAAGLDVNGSLNPEGLRVSAMDIAALTGAYELFPVLVAHGYDLEAPNAGNNRTLLMSAAALGDLERITNLVTYGADLETPDADDGNTAFQYALYFGNIDAAQLLLELGANPFYVDRSGRNSADMAYNGGYQESIDYVEALGLARTEEAAS